MRDLQIVLINIDGYVKYGIMDANPESKFDFMYSQMYKTYKGAQENLARVNKLIFDNAGSPDVNVWVEEALEDETFDLSKAYDNYDNVKTSEGFMHCLAKGMRTFMVDVNIETGHIIGFTEKPNREWNKRYLPDWLELNYCVKDRKLKPLLITKDKRILSTNQISKLLVSMLDLYREPSVIEKRGNNIYWKWSDWDLEINDEGLLPIKKFKKFVNAYIARMEKDDGK